MGLFDFFKKKPIAPKFPLNPLEKALMDASSNIEARAHFYHLLLQDNVFTITDGPIADEDLKKGAPLSILALKKGKLPVFTAKERIFDNGYFNKKVSYAQLKGQDLFENTRGAAFILNPFSDYGKELLATEIETMLDGSIFESLKGKSKKIVIKEETKVQLFKPKEIPAPLQNAICTELKKLPEVKAAYLAGIAEKKGEEPHWILGIDTDGDITTASQAVGPATVPFLDGRFIDIIAINPTNEVSDFFASQTDPIYTRET
ncbi:enhanced serine sensitivity protein SseB [Neptunitalea lumnitzerae]|uniref:SseB protein N-terminal domain-containing protein n=1 Tax=Neptunitalea lumnitzerae TaxID=2965509 RepID=A0ABQ5MEG8_9FLAO|nr:enhanced serine sensitivity protein SseB [Neptunitalea sp. Y10]GLB47779.1 hypothetical protein Y10_01470 [Neptunitalea sp. Y10]